MKNSIPGYTTVKLPDCCYTCEHSEMPKAIDWWYCSLYNEEISLYGVCANYYVVTRS